MNPRQASRPAAARGLQIHDVRADVARAVFDALILIVPAAATAPALVIVGVFMMQSIVEIDMKDSRLPRRFADDPGDSAEFQHRRRHRSGSHLRRSPRPRAGRAEENDPSSVISCDSFLLRVFKIWPFRA